MDALPRVSTGPGYFSKFFLGQESTQDFAVSSVQFSSVQSLTRVWLFATPWTVAQQASLSITNFQSSPKLMSIELVMPSSHLILCHPLLLQPSIFPSITVFSNESVLPIRWPENWSFNFSFFSINDCGIDLDYRVIEWFETPILWPSHAKSWLIGKDLDAGKYCGQEEKGMTEDEMAGWHHRLNGHEFGWTLGAGEGQGGLICCDLWGFKESELTEQLNWTENTIWAMF